MKRLVVVFLAVVAVLAWPRSSMSQDAAAIQARVKWLQSVAASSGLYYAELQSLGLTEASTPQPYRPPDPTPPGPYPYTSYVATNDSPNQDVEPSIANVQIGYTRYITTAYMTYYANTGQALLRSATTTDSFGVFTPSTLPEPATIPGHSAFVQNWDPWLGANTGGGVAQGRMYAVGIAATYQAGSPFTAVALWRSDNGGSVWSNPTVIATADSLSTILVDKPNVAVNTNNGYVFVTFVDYPDYTGNNVRVHFSRSTDGGVTFSAPTTPWSGSGNGAQLAVNTRNNNLYLSLS